jgi:L-threonylcarbamoyladenylate synthase
VNAPTAADFADCIASGGVAIFPADTVYGLACDPENPQAVKRLYELKGRPPTKPAAVMWFDREPALAALPELGERTRAAIAALTPGGVTLLVPNPRRRFPLAAGPAGEGGALGMRLPLVPQLQAVPLVVLQSSANHAGGSDARAIDDIPQDMRDRADLQLDAGLLPGTPSTVVDLRDYEDGGRWEIVREGAVATAEIARALDIVGGPP